MKNRGYRSNMRCSVHVTPSTAEHAKAVFGVFTERKISKRKIIAAYYSSLIYTPLSIQLLLMQKYGDESIKVSISMFNRCALAIPDMTSDIHCVDHSCWIVAAQYCANGSIRNARYWTPINAPTAVKQLLHVWTTFFWGSRDHQFLPLISPAFEFSVWLQGRKLLYG